MCLLCTVCDCTVTVAVPDFDASCLLVAVIVAAPAAAGAVKRPVELMLPRLADHVTAELKFPEPFTVALHCEVALMLTVAGVQATDTDVMVEEDACTVTAAVPDFVVS
jgi:hypothetical protein